MKNEVGPKGEKKEKENHISLWYNAWEEGLAGGQSQHSQLGREAVGPEPPGRGEKQQRAAARSSAQSPLPRLGRTASFHHHPLGWEMRMDLLTSPGSPANATKCNSDGPETLAGLSVYR